MLAHTDYRCVYDHARQQPITSATVQVDLNSPDSVSGFGICDSSKDAVVRICFGEFEVGEFEDGELWTQSGILLTVNDCRV